MSFHLSNTELSAKETKRGQRVFISNALLSSKSKLKIGDKLSVQYDCALKRITLTKALDTDKSTISVTPSGKRFVVDLHNQSVAKCFGNLIKTVSVMFYKNKLIVQATRAAVKAYQRIIAAKDKLSKNIPISMGEICSGISGLGMALSSGFEAQGAGLRLAFANDYDIEAMECSVKNNPTWDEESIALHCSIEQIPVDLLPSVDVLVASLSCKGASRQARTGKKTSCMEFHSEAGWLIAPLYHLIASDQLNPLIVILENVCEYLDTASAEILRQSMSRLGYICHETTVSSQDFGVIEGRKRMVMVFVTCGIKLDLSELALFHKPVTDTMADIIDHSSAPLVPESFDVPLKDRNGWYLKDRLLEREAEAKAKGKGHRACVLKGGDTKTSTITASY
jgi:DNA (cytosine-5)-methyltransferase 1